MLYHVTTAEALASILEGGIQPRIGPRSARMGETVHAVYAFASIKAVENALMGWLGEELPEDAEVAVIEIGMEADPQPGSFEVVLAEAVPPSLISRVLDESLCEIRTLASSAVLP